MENWLEVMAGEVGNYLAGVFQIHPEIESLSTPLYNVDYRNASKFTSPG